MGTIVIEEYNATGSAANRDYDAPVLNSIKATTVDATTSSTAETVTAGKYTRFISVFAVEAHRVAFGSDTTATVYAYIPAGGRREFGIDPETAIYYRTNA